MRAFYHTCLSHAVPVMLAILSLVVCSKGLPSTMVGLRNGPVRNMTNSSMKLPVVKDFPVYAANVPDEDLAYNESEIDDPDLEDFASENRLSIEAFLDSSVKAFDPVLKVLAEFFGELLGATQKQPQSSIISAPPLKRQDEPPSDRRLIHFI